MDQEVASVFLQMQVDIDNLQNQINGIGQQTGESFADRFSRTFGNVARYRVANHIINMFSQAFTELTTGAEEFYETQLVAETKLQTVMERRMNATAQQVQEVKDLASDLQETGVVGDEVTIAGLAQFSTFVNDVQSVKNMAVAMQNLAVSNGGLEVSDMTGVANQLGKAMANNSLGELVESGITLSTEESETFKNMTDEAEKVAYLAEIINSNVGDANRNLAKTIAGQKQQSENAFGDAKEKVGQIKELMSNAFIDIYNNVLVGLNALLDKGIEFANAFNDFMERMGLKSAKENIDEETKAITDEAEAVEALNEAASEMAGFDQFNTIGGDGETSTDSTIEGLDEMVNNTENETKKSIGNTQNCFTDFFNGLGNTIDAFANSQFVKDLENVFQNIVDTYGPGLAEAGGKVATAFGDLMDSLGPVGSFLQDFLITCIDNLGQAFAILGIGLGNLFSWILEAISSVLDFLHIGGGLVTNSIGSFLGGDVDSKETWAANTYDIISNNEWLSKLGMVEKVDISDDSANKIASALLNNQQDQTINLQVDMDGDVLTSKVVKNINSRNKYSGTNTIR